MRVYLLGLALCSMAARPASAYAQETVPAGELFLGTSKLSGSTASADLVCSPGNCKVVTRPSMMREPYHNDGWAGSITGNLNRFAGIEMDVVCCQKPEWPISGEQSTFLFGPHFSYRGNARMNPFAHALMGLTSGRQYAAAPYARTTWRPGFATGLGGGLDVKATRFLWIRVIQADYLRQSFRDDLQRNRRLSFGIVFRFGSLRANPH